MAEDNFGRHLAPSLAGAIQRSQPLQGSQGLSQPWQGSQGALPAGPSTVAAAVGECEREIVKQMDLLLESHFKAVKQRLRRIREVACRSELPLDSSESIASIAATLRQRPVNPPPSITWRRGGSYMISQTPDVPRLRWSAKSQLG